MTDEVRSAAFTVRIVYGGSHGDVVLADLVRDRIEPAHLEKGPAGAESWAGVEAAVPVPGESVHVPKTLLHERLADLRSAALAVADDRTWATDADRAGARELLREIDQLQETVRHWGRAP